MSAENHPNNAPGIPMLMPPRLEALQIKFMNPAMKRVARFLPGFAIVQHRGRKSGVHYETVVNATRSDNLVAIGLMHGKTNWVKNVLAAGETDIRLFNGVVHVSNPRVIPKGADDHALPGRIRSMSRRVGVFVADVT